MDTELLDKIKDEVAKELFNLTWGELNDDEYNENQCWPKICQRYAIEVAKASLKKASDKIEEKKKTLLSPERY